MNRPFEILTEIGIAGAIAFNGCPSRPIQPSPNGPTQPSLVELRDPAYSKGCVGQNGSLYPQPDSIGENAAQHAWTQNMQDRLLHTPGIDSSVIEAWKQSSDPLSDFLSVITAVDARDRVAAIRFNIPLTLLRQVEIIRCTGELADPTWQERVERAVESYVRIVSVMDLEKITNQGDYKLIEDGQFISSVERMGRLYRHMGRMFYGQHFGELKIGGEETSPPTQEAIANLDAAIQVTDSWSHGIIAFVYGKIDTMPTLAPFDQLIPQDNSQEPLSPKELGAMVKADIEDTLAVRGLPTLKTLNQIFP